MFFVRSSTEKAKELLAVGSGNGNGGGREVWAHRGVERTEDQGSRRRFRRRGVGVIGWGKAC